MYRSVGKEELKRVFIFCTGGNGGLFLFLRRIKLFGKENSYSQITLCIDCFRTEDYCKIVIAEMLCHYSSKNVIITFGALRCSLNRQYEKG